MCYGPMLPESKRESQHLLKSTPLPLLLHKGFDTPLSLPSHTGGTKFNTHYLTQGQTPAAVLLLSSQSQAERRVPDVMSWGISQEQSHKDDVLM